MTLVKRNYNPWNNLLEDVLGNFSNTEMPKSLNVPPVNILENNDHFSVEVAAPGLTKQDFKLHIEDNLLTISFEKAEDNKEQKTENSTKVHRREFGTKSFKRTFTLDDKIDITSISAKYDNGILFITLPKKEEVKQTPTSIEIQ